MNKVRKPKLGRPLGIIPCAGSILAINMGTEYRDKIHEAARAAGLSTRQFILRLVDREMKRQRSKINVTDDTKDASQ